MTTLGRRMNRRQDRCNLLGLCLTLGAGMGTTTRTGPSCWASSWQASHPGHRQQARPAHPAQPPLCKRIAGAETECPSLLDLHPDAKQDRQLATKKAECQSLLDLHQDVKQGRAAAGHQEGRVPEPAGPPPAKQPGKREPQALPLQPPAKKTASASTPAAEFRQTLQEYAKKNVEVPKVIPKIPPEPSRCAELGRKGRERQASAISGPQRKGQGHGPKGSGPRPTPRRKGPSR